MGNHIFATFEWQQNPVRRLVTPLSVAVALPIFYYTLTMILSCYHSKKINHNLGRRHYHNFRSDCAGKS